jgi:hypothetical protein
MSLNQTGWFFNLNFTQLTMYHLLYHLLNCGTTHQHPWEIDDTRVFIMECHIAIMLICQSLQSTLDIF